MTSILIRLGRPRLDNEGTNDASFDACYDVSPAKHYLRCPCSARYSNQPCAAGGEAGTTVALLSGSHRCERTVLLSTKLKPLEWLLSLVVPGQELSYAQTMSQDMTGSMVPTPIGTLSIDTKF